MKTREEALEYVMAFADAYLDVPFHDDNMEVVHEDRWTYSY